LKVYLDGIPVSDLDDVAVHGSSLGSAERSAEPDDGLPKGRCLGTSPSGGYLDTRIAVSTRFPLARALAPATTLVPLRRTGLGPTTTQQRARGPSCSKPAFRLLHPTRGHTVGCCGQSALER
jgi:hypothetical protein